MTIEVQNATFYHKDLEEGSEIHCYASGPTPGGGYGNSGARGLTEQNVVLNLHSSTYHTFGQILKVANGSGPIIVDDSHSFNLHPDSFDKVRRMLEVVLPNTQIEVVTHRR